MANVAEKTLQERLSGWLLQKLPVKVNPAIIPPLGWWIKTSAATALTPPDMPLRLLTTLGAGALTLGLAATAAGAAYLAVTLGGALGPVVSAIFGTASLLCAGGTATAFVTAKRSLKKLETTGAAFAQRMAARFGQFQADTFKAEWRRNLEARKAADAAKKEAGASTPEPAQTQAQTQVQAKAPTPTPTPPPAQKPSSEVAKMAGRGIGKLFGAIAKGTADALKAEQDKKQTPPHNGPKPGDRK